MNKVLRVSIFAVGVLFFVSCQSVPRLAKVDPPYYEDDNVRIDYRIGVKVYYITILNKTGNEIEFVTNNGLSIISIDGQTRSLNPASEDAHIPPYSRLVMTSSKDAFFKTDIDMPFKPDMQMDRVRVRITKDVDISEEDYIKQFKGGNIRLYIPLIIQGKEKIYDIELYIDGVKEL